MFLLCSYSVLDVCMTLPLHVHVMLCCSHWLHTTSSLCFTSVSQANFFGFDFRSGLLEQTSKAKIEGKALPILPSVGVVDEEKMR